MQVFLFSHGYPSGGKLSKTVILFFCKQPKIPLIAHRGSDTLFKMKEDFGFILQRSLIGGENERDSPKQSKSTLNLKSTVDFIATLHYKIHRSMPALACLANISKTLLAKHY